MNEQHFRNQIRCAAEEHALATTVLFEIFYDRLSLEELGVIRNVIKDYFPDALIAGSSSYGTIVDGDFASGSIIVTASFFELPSTKIEVLSYPLGPDGAADVAQQLIGEIDSRPWVKAIEILIMNNDEPLDEFCDVMSTMREDVMMFGAESHFSPVLNAPRFVIGAQGEVIEWGAVFVLFGGEDLHFLMRYVQGWKPLGRQLTATSFSGNILHELDGQPAFELFHRYLQIDDDENFMANAIEFPFLFKVDEVTSVVRTPIVCTPGGSIILASPVPPSGQLRIGCGDPEEVIDTVADCGRLIASFRPDAIMAFSCVARRMFWSDAGSSRETLPLYSIAPTSGFYTAGELLRVNGRLLEHNSTLILGAVREGDLEDKPEVQFVMPDERHKKSLVSRFASFIDAATDELRDANRQLEILSKTDGLTGVANRREIEAVIRASCKGLASNAPSLIMMDLDDFKQINDTYGHHEGDEALKRFANLCQQLSQESDLGISIGRWGGEEFIMLARGCDQRKAAEFAERLRHAFETQQWDCCDARHTVSIGVTRYRIGENVDAALSRVDKALYNAKDNGKNCVAVLD